MPPKLSGAPLKPRGLGQFDANTQVPTAKFARGPSAAAAAEGGPVHAPSEPTTRGNNVQVIARFRPEGSAEQRNAELHVEPESAKVAVASQTYTLDAVLPGDTSQTDFFRVVGTPVVEHVLGGYNATVLTYGHTGSGKTYAMLGPDGGSPAQLASEERGVVPRVLELLVARLSSRPDWRIKLAVFELYNEEWIDLLRDSAPRLRETRTTGREGFLHDIQTKSVNTAEEMLGFIRAAASRKHVGGTQANETSSRSHTFVQLFVEQIEDGVMTSARLFLVDLAGAERISESGAEGERLGEAIKINTGLSKLGHVINQLTTSSLHVNYNDSKLTRLLKGSLGGDAMTTLLCCCSPSQRAGSATMRTLQFAARAKQVKNKPHAHKQLSEPRSRTDDSGAQLQADLAEALQRADTAEEAARAAVLECDGLRRRAEAAEAAAKGAAPPPPIWAMQPATQVRMHHALASPPSEAPATPVFGGSSAEFAEPLLPYVPFGSGNVERLLRAAIAGSP